MKSVLFLIPFIIWQLMFYSSVNAQVITKNIRGTIIDEDSQVPLIGASIIIIDSDPITGATTDENGNFIMENVPIGRYDLEVAYLGYKSKIIPGINLGAGKDVVLNISLIESTIDLDEVVVSPGQKKEETVNELNIVSTRAFTVEETKRYAGSFDDPSRMAASFAGVRGGDYDEDNAIIIRGNSPRMLLWRLDGIEIPSPNHFTEEGASSGSVSILSNNMLSNSDFSTGAFASEYGNALSGVFDIKMRKGNNQKGEYAFKAGFLGLDASMEGPFKKGYGGSYLVNYRYSTLAILKAIGLKIIGDAVPVFQDLSYNLNFPTKSAGSFTVFGIGGLSHIEDQSVREYPDGTEEVLWKDKFVSNMGATGVIHKYIINDKTYMRSHLSLAGTYSEYIFDGKMDNGTFLTENNEAFTNIYSKAGATITNKFSAKHMLKSGVEATYQNFKLSAEEYDFELDRLVPLVMDKGNTYALQAFTNYRYRFNDQLTFNTGVHAMYFDLNGDYSIEPRAAIKWQFLPTHSFTVGFGIHSRREAPSIYTASVLKEDFTTYQPNLNLGFSKARHYVVGYESMLAPNLHLKAEAYYQDLYDVPIVNDSMNYGSAINFESGIVNVPLENLGTGRNYGVELTLEKFFARKYYFLVTGSLYESRYTAADGIERNSRFNNNFITNFLVGKEFHFGKNKDDYLTINLKVVYTGGSRYTPIDLEASEEAGYTVRYWDRAYEAKGPNYFRSDFAISYTRNKKRTTMEWKLDIQNVTNAYNVRNYWYDPVLNEVIADETGALIPILSYEVRF